MGRFTVRLPDTLHHELISQAQNEGVSLNQYVVFALTRQMSFGYTVEAVSASEIRQQKEDFDALLQRLGPPDRKAAAEYLSTREVVEPESEYAAELIARVQAKIAEANNRQPK